MTEERGRILWDIGWTVLDGEDSSEPRRCVYALDRMYHASITVMDS
jgi:hypothetical protein